MRIARPRGWLVLAGLLLASACTSHIDGTITVDGQPFKVSRCRSGAAFSFSGIELADSSDHRLRLVQMANGSVQVALFPPGEARGADLGIDCGTIRMEAQNSTINNIRNMQGHAELACEGGGHKVAGTISFDNCH